MGLAASQAKLLSLTSRISSNELRAQDITRAKTRLSDETDAVHKKYTAALDNKQLTYLKYDEDGNQKYVHLTGHELTSYSPLKNQFGLINSAGQILVSETDAANYQNSSNVNEFLEKYGFPPIDTGKTYKVTNPAYTEAYEKYQKDYEEWLGKKPNVEDYKTYIPSTDNAIYNAVKNSGGCFSLGMSGLNCYMHVLSDLIGPGVHKTSDGHEFEIKTAISWNWNSAKHDINVFAPITEMLKNGHCSGDVIEGSAVIDGVECNNIAIQEVDNNGVPMQKYVGGTVSDPNMSLWQRAVDLLWEVHEDYDGSATGGNAKTLSFAKFLYFVEHDLKQAVMEEKFDQAAYDKDYAEWEESEPPAVTVPEFLEEKIYTYSDNDEAQWYVNLWHRMNGEAQEKAGDVDATTTTLGGKTQNGGTIPSNKWDILEDGLMNSASWLQRALQQGTVTLEKVVFTDPTKEGTGIKHGTWTSIIYSSATEISEEANQERIAKAEAEFEEKTKIIEAKDKQYDSVLKLLDTEHSALQEEYDSIKNVISKNIDRTLKMYSA